MATKKKRGIDDVSIEGIRSDKKFDCYPWLAAQTVEQITWLAEASAKTKTAVAGELAHLALWNQSALDPLRPYMHFPLLFTWQSGSLSNVFYCWNPDLPAVKDIRPVIQEARSAQAIKTKFRIILPDRHRLQALVHALNLTTADAIWPVLLSLVLLQPRLVTLVVGSRDVGLSGRHPISGDWIETHTGAEGGVLV